MSPEKSYLYAKPIFGDQEKQAVNRVLDTEWLSGHEQTARFEQELASWWGRRYAVAVNSGSSANFIATQALELPKGSEVITPAGLAFPTTVAPLYYLGLRPHFVDVDPENFAIDIKRITVHPKTRAIIFAHSLGNMPDMAEVMSFAKRYQLKVIEDVADAMGSVQYGKKAGTFGDMATVSFYPAHMMTTGGEGGAILMDDPQLYRLCRSIRDWGRDCFCIWGKQEPACKNRFGNPPHDHRYYYTQIGLNLKMTEMQAAFGREQLRRVDGFNEIRKRNYRIIAEILGKPVNPEIVPFAYPVLTPIKEWVVKTLNEQYRIQTRGMFTGNILRHPAYGEMNKQFGIKPRVEDNLWVSEKLFNEGFFVGVGPHLSEDDAEYIGNALKKLTGEEYHFDT